MDPLWMKVLWLPIGCALLAWLSAVVHWIGSLGHLSGKTSLGGMLFSGFAAFDSKNFTERGRVLQRRFKWSFGAFFASIALGVLVSVVARR
jgi:hypothetical protein